MGRGNGAHKISSIWLDHEISVDKAVEGDMIIIRETGQWDRIKNMVRYPDTMTTKFLTKFGKEFMLDEVIVVRY